MPHRILFLFSIVLFTGCNENNSGYSFDEIINLRLSDNDNIDGSEVQITSKFKSSFAVACAAVAYEPCVDPIDGTEGYESVEEYGHFRNSLGHSCGGEIYLSTNNGSQYERLVVDYTEHSEFYMITEDKEITATVLAKVEFTEEVDHCDKKIYKGTKITLSEGQHAKLLNKFISADD